MEVMPKIRPGQIRYGRGTINPTAGGKFDCYILNPATRRRHTRRVGSLVEARQWLDMTEDAIAADAPPLSHLQLADAAHAVALLPPGFTLTDAARALAEAQAPARDTTPLLEALDRFLAAKRLVLREVTVDEYRKTVSRLARLTGPIPAAAVTPVHIEGILAGLRPVSRNNQLRNLAAFFHWCQAEGIVARAPTDRTPRARAPDPPKGILTPAESKRLLETAVTVAPELVPVLALGLFAGIRPAEIGRLEPGKVGREWIILDGHATKTALTRNIRIRPTLSAWLRAYPFSGVPEKNAHRRLMEKLVKAANVTWKHDCLRHSHATYAYELSKDPVAIAADMGTGVRVFHTHYRALGHPGDGRKFFAIRPPARPKFHAEQARDSDGIQTPS